MDEGLKEEIYGELSRFAGHVVRYRASGDRHAEHECKTAFAESLIVRVGGVVLNGESEELDKTLGVAGRGRINADGMLLDARDAIGIWDLKEGDTLVAFRGEGAEEEG